MSQKKTAVVKLAMISNIAKSSNHAAYGQLHSKNDAGEHVPDLVRMTIMIIITKKVSGKRCLRF